MRPLHSYFELKETEMARYLDQRRPKETKFYYYKDFEIYGLVELKNEAYNYYQGIIF